MVISTRAKVIAAVLGIFVLGAAAGGAGAYAYAQRETAAILDDDDSQFEDRRRGAFERKLDLTDEQRDRIRDVFARHRKEHRELARRALETCGEPLSNEQEKLDREIRDVLTEEQKPRYEELARKRWQRSLLKPPKGHRFEH